MKKKIYNVLILPFSMLILSSLNCKVPFDPKIITSPTNYLVVEGVINAGSDSTTIRLSRTVNLTSLSAQNSESGAVVSVVNDQNLNDPFIERSKGIYVATNLNLDTSQTYRLKIITSNQQQYLSDPIKPKITPPIDSVGMSLTGSGLSIYANTHDAQNNTRYYRWDYSETWQFNSKYLSGEISNGMKILDRLPDQNVFSCFGNDSSSNILIGTSAKLSQDVIYQQPISLIPPTSEKVELEYSILLHQYALTVDAYAFYSNLKKNTEQLGSIFNAQPFNLTGNIHNVNNPSEPVIGYISSSTVQSKRIFISRSLLPQTWMATYPYDCPIDTIAFGPAFQYYVDLYLIPLNSDFVPTRVTLTAQFYSTRECVDCTLRGTTNPPAFWRYNYSSFGTNSGN